MIGTSIGHANTDSSPVAPPEEPVQDGRRNRAGGSYSRFAHSMRITLPLVAVAIAIIVIAWPQLGEKPKRFSLGISKVTVNDGGGQQIVNPRFTGTDSEARPFTLTADAASQNQTNPTNVDLSFPRADITLASGAWLAVSAESGLFDRENQMLTLSGSVNLFHDAGYELRTASADVDLNAGVAMGSDPVTGQGPFGLLTSTGFQIFDHGKRVIFSGKSKLILYPSADKPGRPKG